MPTHTFKELRDEFTARPENAALLAEALRLDNTGGVPC